MARYLYAASPADYVVDGSTGLPVPGAVVTVWTARTGGSQVTDLQTVGGSPITQVTADSAGFLAFYGPDGLTDNLWLYSGSGSRLVVQAVVNPTPSGTALPLAGGTMTGNLTLAGAPSADLHAATKKYVDDNVANFVDVTGDTMSGTLRVHQASLKVSGDASTYVFERRQGDGTGYGFRLGATSTLPISASLYDSGGNTLTAALNYSTSTTRWNITGNTYIDGTLTMNSKKISGLAEGTANGDAVRYEQLGAFTTWTPTITAATSNPSGFSTQTGRYISSSKRVTGWGKCLYGGSAAVGSGQWRFPLPVAPAQSTHYPRVGYGMIVAGSAIMEFQLELASNQNYCNAIITGRGLPYPTGFTSYALAANFIGETWYDELNSWVVLGGSSYVSTYGWQDLQYVSSSNLTSGGTVGSSVLNNAHVGWTFDYEAV